MFNLTNHQKWVILKQAALTVEEITNVSWRVTSWIRNAPTHKYAISLDIAPDFTSPGWQKDNYATYKQSDPMLDRRVPLFNRLKAGEERLSMAIPVERRKDLIILAFIEPDHIHLQITKMGTATFFSSSVIPLPKMKLVFNDVQQRRSLEAIHLDHPTAGHLEIPLGITDLGKVRYETWIKWVKQKMGNRN